jgi:uncharacterized protein YkwD
VSATGDVLRLVNELRAEEGLRPLAGDAQLAKVGLRRATICARRDKLSHSGWLDALRAGGFRIGSRSFGEVLARGQDRPADVVRAWMASPPHRQNLLAKDFRRVGFGLAEGAGDRWWAGVFSS